MGRGPSIEGRKNATDARRGKIFTKVIREITGLAPYVRTARDRPWSRVNRSRSQSHEAPNRRSWRMGGLS